MSSDNIYQAPDAELQVDNGDVDEFFVVSTRKLWIMHLLTFSVYDVYWFYRHWDALKLKRNLSVSPGLRGLFYVFFVYSMLKHIQEAAEYKRLDDIPNLKLLSGLWYLLFLVPFMAGLFAGFGGEDSALFALVSNVWLTFPLSVVNYVITGYIFTTAQRVANRVVGDDAGEKNNRITAANLAWIVVLLLLNLASAYNAAQSL